MAKIAAGSKRKSNPPKAVPNYKTLGGHDAQTTALKNVLAAQGVKRSEALLFGLGGGLGFGYHVHEASAAKDQSHLLLGLRNRWEDLGATWLETIAKRIGAVLETKETDNARGASNLLANAVKTKGRGAIVWVDMASLPWHHLPSSLVKYVPHAITVFGLDEDASAALVDDTAKAPFLLSIDDLADARAAIEGFKNRFSFVESVDEKKDLKEGIVAGIRESASAILKPERDGFGADGIAAWAEKVVDNRSNDGWGKIFPGVELVVALTEAYTWLELGTGGGAFRPLYAEFLREAAGVTGNKKLEKVAEQYLALGVQWSELAQALLPDPRFKWVREALVKKHTAIAGKGAAGMSDAEKATKEVVSTSKTAAEKAFAPADLKAFTAALAKKIEGVAAAEKKAAKALSDAI